MDRDERRNFIDLDLIIDSVYDQDVQGCSSNLQQGTLSNAEESVTGVWCKSYGKI